MENYGKIIHRTWDNSYVINDGTYHVPNNEEFKSQWEQVHTYALANPDMVTEEYPYVPPAPTTEEIQKMLTDGVQNYMDKKAQERGYDNIHTACSYAYSTDEVFAKEGKACLEWRDKVWRTCYDILAQVIGGLREVPTLEEVLAELPAFNWGDEV